jgi:hypothetical protein
VDVVEVAVGFEDDVVEAGATVAEDSTCGDPGREKPLRSPSTAEFDEHARTIVDPTATMNMRLVRRNHRSRLLGGSLPNVIEDRRCQRLA